MKSRTPFTPAGRNRISKTENGVTTIFVVDTQNPTGYAQVQQEKLPSGVIKVSYLLGHDVIAQAKPASDHRLSDDDALVYVLYDGHGSTRGLITPTGVVAATYDYDAYGLLIGDEGLTGTARGRA